MTAELSFGVGLWNLRSTARFPSSSRRLYASMIEKARLAEALGFDSFWLGEHRFWYDGWCPQPIVAGAAIAGATERLRVGTSVHLLAQHEASRSLLAAQTFDRLFPGRLELGVGLGYRPEEYDGLGLAFDQRGKRQREAMDAIIASSSSARLWGGGMAPPAIARAARRGLPLLLPPGLNADEVRNLVDVAGEAATEAGTTIPTVGLLKDIWVAESDEAAREFFLPRLTDHYLEYAVAWWSRTPEGTVNEAHVKKQVDRALSAAIVGSPETVAGKLREFRAAGVRTFVLQCHVEATDDVIDDQLRMLADSVVPRVREESA